jgi:hypothetical protein
VLLKEGEGEDSKEIPASIEVFDSTKGVIISLIHFSLFCQTL